MLIPRPHQVKVINEAKPILEENHVVYLSMEERTGKSIIALILADMFSNIGTLIVTVAKGVPDWNKVIDGLGMADRVRCINYESIHKVDFLYDSIVLDEAHKFLSAFPKPTQTWRNVKQKSKCCKYFVYSSATPTPQSLSQIYHQFAIAGEFSPFSAYSTFYRWYAVYGLPTMIRANGGKMVTSYKDTKNDLIDKCVSGLFISYTRKELGFEHEPVDQLHYITLPDNIRSLYNKLQKDRVVDIGGYKCIADTVLSLRLKLHQLEGGTITFEVLDAVNNGSLVKKTKNITEKGQTFAASTLHKVVDELHTAKVQYILDTFGDREDIVIMYYYKLEYTLLSKYFKKARILQSDTYARGISLASYSTLIVYSMAFSTETYIQRRARQCDLLRDTPITVHYLLVQGGISSQVYTTVAINKKNFTDIYYTNKDI